MPYFYRFFIEKYKETVIRLESLRVDEKNESGLSVSHKDSGGGYPGIASHCGSMHA